jgi:hypothetical protein
VWHIASLLINPSLTLSHARVLAAGPEAGGGASLSRRGAESLVRQAVELVSAQGRRERRDGDARGRNAHIASARLAISAARSPTSFSFFTKLLQMSS